ncbi:unnamed protein product [Paramecium sonneborni]|uniref:Uncharacterized protein n=1 Tax=Paramecium sonneborni TaxID=65129 RepID=A0A8S1RS68_9CILI|nr:unnamed protein product [Paramecium sonneborni]
MLQIRSESKNGYWRQYIKQQQQQKNVEFQNIEKQVNGKLQKESNLENLQEDQKMQKQMEKQWKQQETKRTSLDNDKSITRRQYIFLLLVQQLKESYCCNWRCTNDAAALKKANIRFMEITGFDAADLVCFKQILIILFFR